MEKIENIISEIENSYKEQGYSLIATAYLYVPWFKCTLQCKYNVERLLSEFDIIIVKCIKRNINTIRDIAYVLGLDSIIVDAEIQSLIKVDFLKFKNNILSITESGEKLFENYSKIDSQKKDCNVYMNCITGEWTTENINFSNLPNDFQKENNINIQDISDIKPIILKPLFAVSNEKVENNSELRKTLNEKYDIQILSMHIMDYKTIHYELKKVFLFRNEDKHISFTLCNCDNMQPDDILASALRERYERRELLEILQVEKFIKDAENYFTSQNKVAASYDKPISQNKYLRNKEIRYLFNNIFDTAQKSVFIICPWIDNNQYVVTYELLDKIENALKERNLSITIGYGYISKEKLNKKIQKYTSEKNEIILNDKDYESYLMAETMKKRFAQYKNFKIFHVGGTHEKILSYDNQYTLIASYNFLSYDGGESNNFTGYNFRFEGGVLIDDIKFAEYIKNCFISYDC